MDTNTLIDHVKELINRCGIKECEEMGKHIIVVRVKKQMGEIVKRENREIIIKEVEEQTLF